MSDAQPTQKPVILISGGGTTIPLARHLAERYDLVFWSPQAAQAVADSGIRNVAALGALVDAEINEQADATLAAITARAVNGMPQITRSLVGAYAGMPQIEQLRPERLRDWWPAMVMTQLRGVIPALAALDKLGEARTVVAAVVHEDVTLEMRALVGWCRTRNIPTVHVPHAPCHLRPDAGRDIHTETRADWIAASGQYMAEFYARYGFPAERIRITGAPQWDNLYRGSVPERAEAKQIMGVKGEPRVMGYATTWWQTTSLRGGFENELNVGFETVLAAARALEAFLIVKVHPNEGQSEDAYKAVLEQYGVRGLITRHHLTYAVRAMDVLVAQGPSNLCIEAAILGTPSVYIQTAGFDYATPLPLRVQTGNPGALMAAIQAGGEATPDDWEAMLTTYNAAHPDGGAAERAAEFVAEIAG